jgi:hypothetical protein
MAGVRSAANASFRQLLTRIVFVFVCLSLRGRGCIASKRPTQHVMKTAGD